MEIDKEILKEYINSETKHVSEIIDYKIENKKIYKSMINPYSQMINELGIKFGKYGYIEMTFIRPTWNGWSLVTESDLNKHLIGTFVYRENRGNDGFNIESYKRWLRNYKLNQIL